jgi:inner membrane transporter RhtA
LPAIATIIGVVVITRIPSWVEAVAVALVIAGVAVRREHVAEPGLGRQARATAVAPV